MPHASDRIAAIDIGSNSVRLLLCDVCEDGSLVASHKEIRPTRISQGLAASGRLQEEAMERTCQGVAELQKVAQEGGAQRVLCYATSAVRDADNRDDFIRLVHKRTSCLVDVLTEEQEAQAGYAGVQAAGPRAVLDIGGGSSEIALGTGTVPEAAISLRLGAVRAMERYPLGDVADALSLEAMEQWAQHTLEKGAADLRAQVQATPDVAWYGVGGTITTLAAMEQYMRVYDGSKIQGFELHDAMVERWLKKLSQATLEQRLNLIGLPQSRADIILGGVVVLRAILRYMGVTVLSVSDTDNLEGYIRMRLYGEAHAQPGPEIEA